MRCWVANAHLGGLKPSRELLHKFEGALGAFGASSEFQSNLAGTVFTVADYSHKVLEVAEYGGGLLTGGTYTAATLTTKAGFRALLKTIARNYVEEQAIGAAARRLWLRSRRVAILRAQRTSPA